MVTRSRQRESENEISLNGYIPPKYISASISFAPPPNQFPRHEKPVARLKSSSRKLKRVQQEVKQEETKLKNGWYWRDYYRNNLEWRTVSKNYAFLDGHWNYQ